MSDILSNIVTYKHQEVKTRKALLSLSALDARIKTTSAPRGFETALRKGKPDKGLSLIAEIKKASPSKGLIRADFDPPALAKAYAEGGAHCLSILTDAPSFQGHEDYFIAARAATHLPCIRKDFLVDVWQVSESRAIGADCILIIMAMIDDSLAQDLFNAASALGMDALIEVHDHHEMERALRLGGTMIGVNNRNLKTFEVDLQTTIDLAKMVENKHLLVTESGIYTARDAHLLAHHGAQAMLVGESLMRQDDVGAATKKLLTFS
jgi:indole-3-glycerol phosphate synthase